MKAWKAWNPFDEPSKPDAPVTNEILQSELVKIRTELTQELSHVKNELIFWTVGGRPMTNEIHEGLVRDHQEIRAFRAHLEELHRWLIDFDNRLKALEMAMTCFRGIRPKSGNPKGGSATLPPEEPK